MNITWKTDDLTIEQCARLSGWTVAELQAKLVRPGFKNTAACKAAGAWDANDREAHALWSSLEKLAAIIEINEAIAGWEKLAVEQDEATAYEESRGQYAGVHKNRVELYRRTAESLRLELEKGEPHCVCCLKPAARHRK